MLKKIIALSALALLSSALPAELAAAPGDAVILRPQLPQIGGDYDIVVRLPVSASEFPTVPANQVCSLVQIEIGEYQNKSCRVGPSTVTSRVFKPLVTRTAAPVYDAQAHTCRARGSLRLGDFAVRARFLTSPTQRTWQPAMSNQIESISTEQNFSMKLRQTVTVDLRLVRQMVIQRPSVTSC